MDRSQGRSSSPACCSTTDAARPPRPAARAPERLQAGPHRAARGALPGGLRLCRSRRDPRVTHGEIDRSGLHALEPRRPARGAAGARAAGGDLPRRRLPPREAAPEHLAVVDGDGRSAAIAAASIVAKVVARPRDAPPRRALPAVRVLVPRRLHHAGSLGARPRARAVAIHRRSLRRSATKVGRGVALALREAGRAARRRPLQPARLPRARRATCGQAATSSISSCGAAGGSCSAR